MAEDLTQSIGVISPPPGVKEQIDKAGSAGGDIPIMWFLSSLLKVGLAFMGIWVLFNFVFASYTYITGRGEAKSHELVKAKLTMSVIGLALIIGAYVVTAVISFLMWGDPSFILNPKIEGP